MLLPLFHDKMTVRRWPWVTTLVVLVTVALHALVTPVQATAEEETLEAARAALSYYETHPYLTARKPLDAISSHVRGRAGGRWVIGNGNRMPPTDDDLLAEEQRELDRLADRLDARIDVEPHTRLGYGPRGRFPGVLTSMFVHGGWAHALFNMWFLALAGMNLEDRWGRPQFLAFYLASGVIAAVCHGLMSGATVIGASGAVAGAMGAFLVLFSRVRIRFLLFFAVTFRAPAWAALPLWAAVEIYEALGASDGVAHWAHLGGFFFGLAVAALLKVSGIDRRLDDAIEKATALEGDPRVDTALALARAGKLDPALAMLEGLAVEQPESVHAHRALYLVHGLRGDDRRAAESRARIRALYGRHGELATAEAALAELDDELARAASSTAKRAPP